MINDELCQTVGHEIQEWRRRFRLSVEALAKLVDIAPARLRRIESAQSDPLLSEIGRLSRALGFHPGELVGITSLEREEFPEPSALQPVIDRAQKYVARESLNHRQLWERLQVTGILESEAWELVDAVFGDPVRMYQAFTEEDADSTCTIEQTECFCNVKQMAAISCALDVLDRKND